MNFIVLSSNKRLTKSIERYLKYVYAIEEIETFLIKENAYESFLIIKDWLEGLFENNTAKIRETMAFIDLPGTDFSELKTVTNSLESLASMIYLAFPEIYWIFITPFTNKKLDRCLDLNAINYFHALFNGNNFSFKNMIENFLYGYIPLFDPTSFRGDLVYNTLKDMYKKQDTSARPFFQKREKKALVVDEELPYAYIHSYSAYKFGYSVLAVSTKKNLDNIKNKFKQIEYSIEDISLSLPDSPIKYKTLRDSLEERNGEYEVFKKIPKRIFVTIGEHKRLKMENRKYRKSFSKNPDFKFYEILYKPYSGIFNLKKVARFKSYLDDKKKKIRLRKGILDSHATPGRLGMIADTLINRSKQVLSKVNNAQDAIHAAMLALQAQEILGGRTATLSIKAISLKHQAEVLAECMFYGVEHNFDVKSRIKEIEDELRIIGRWFSKSKRDIMIYNSELNIVNELARIFRKYSQYYEEQQCLYKVRKLDRKIYQKKQKIWGSIVYPFRFYFEYLMGSLNRFLAAILIWPSVFTLLHFLLISYEKKSIDKSIIYAFNSFFALQITELGEGFPPYPFLSIIAVILGFFHLGILISHLYTIVSKR